MRINVGVSAYNVLSSVPWQITGCPWQSWGTGSKGGYPNVRMLKLLIQSNAVHSALSISGSPSADNAQLVKFVDVEPADNECRLYTLLLNLYNTVVVT